MSDTGRLGFRARARVEADRYGSDPWIFIRELLQNGRDAGATRICFQVAEGAGFEQLRCRDDGEGMSFEHARRYLFSLYASSKEAASNQVGRFGVGFWSILRFEATTIRIRSRPANGPGWEVVLDGDLTRARHLTLEMERGTEIVLERRHPSLTGEARLAARVYDAAHQNGRFLSQRDAPSAPLVVEVDGRKANAEFELPAPSTRFARRHVRGVVGLGTAPRVELFSRGLRVRSAACLDDLVLGTAHTAHSRVRFPELPGAVAPQALLESDALELLLSRNDARDTRALRRLVSLAQDELRRLVERQIDRVHPPGPWEVLNSLVRRLHPQSTLSRSLVGATIGGVLALAIARVLWPAPAIHEATIAAEPFEPPAASAAPATDHYGNLALVYRGPQVSELDPSRKESIALHYSPASERPFFAALMIERPGIDRVGVDLTAEPYRGAPCSRDCIDVELEFAAAAGPLIVPIPTGHVLDVSRLRVDDEATEVARTTLGEPAIVLATARKGRLSYRSGPAREASAAGSPRGDEALPAKLRSEARSLARLPVDARVAAAIGLVRARVRYATDAETSAGHRRALADGEPFVARALRIGAGDCDVLNGLLIPILHEARVPARLAIGWVGVEGVAAPWMHAWVEFLDDRGQWRVADATARERAGERSAAPIRAPRESILGDAPAGANGEANDALVAAGASAPPTANATPRRESASADPASTRSTKPTSTYWRRFAPPSISLATVIAFVMLASLLALLRWRHVRRFVHIDESGDITTLLRGALQQPAAFRHLPALFYRPIIPLRNGRWTSLVRARERAGAGKLYGGSERTELSRRAVARGIPVLDTERPEGQAVASSFGATDLDHWGGLLARSEVPPLLERVNVAARRIGESWSVRVATDLGRDLSTLDVGGLDRTEGGRVILLDAHNPCLVTATAQLRDRPAAALFALLDYLTDHVGIDTRRKAQLLYAPAAAAVAEVAEGETAVRGAPA